MTGVPFGVPQVRRLGLALCRMVSRRGLVREPRAGVFSMGRRAGRAAPDRCAKADVEASIAARCRFLEGADPDRSWVPHSHR